MAEWIDEYLGMQKTCWIPVCKEYEQQYNVQMTASDKQSMQRSIVRPVFSTSLSVNWTTTAAPTAGKLLRALNWVEWLAKYMTKCQFLVTLKSRGMDQQKHHEVQEWWNHKIMYFWRDLLKLSSPDPQFRQSQTVCFQRVFLLQAEQYQLSGSYERCSSSLPQRLYGALNSVSPCLSHTQQFRTKHSTPDAASPVHSRKGFPLLQWWENATNAVQDTFWPSFLWKRTSAVHQNAKVLCRAEKCFLDAWHFDNPGVWSYSTQEKNIAFPSAELHKTPFSAFLQPVKVPLNGNTTIRQLLLTVFYYLWELAEGLLCLTILVFN